MTLYKRLGWVIHAILQGGSALGAMILRGAFGLAILALLGLAIAWLWPW